MYYMISTKTGWFNTTDEKMESEGYTIEKLINELKDDPINKLYFVEWKLANTKQYKYQKLWFIGEGYNI